LGDNETMGLGLGLAWYVHGTDPAGSDGEHELDHDATAPSPLSGRALTA
jgi:hypothetical protein